MKNLPAKLRGLAETFDMRNMWDHGEPVYLEEAAQEIERLRTGLNQVKSMCAGDAAPRWPNDFKVTTMRGAILDVCDFALGNVK